MMKLLGYLLLGFLILLDKLANVILLGSWHKTISMRTSFAVNCKYVQPRYKWVRPFGKFVDTLFHNRFYSIEENHIWHSYEAEEVLSKAFWDWYIVVDQAGYDNLVKLAKELRFMGRE